MGKKWFTMVELVFVLAIIAIISAIFVLKLWKIETETYDTVRIMDVKDISTALIFYSFDHSTFPNWTNTSQLSVLMWGEYWLGWIIPKDPKTKRPYSYKVLQKEHFIICTRLSEWYDTGNADDDYAAKNEYDTYEEPTYDKISSKMTNGWDHYCYLF